jgi:membrane protein YdbS with pleckstrin-like domain
MILVLITLFCLIFLGIIALKERNITGLWILTGFWIVFLFISAYFFSQIYFIKPEYYSEVNWDFVGHLFTIPVNFVIQIFLICTLIKMLKWKDKKTKLLFVITLVLWILLLVIFIPGIRQVVRIFFG